MREKKRHTCGTAHTRGRAHACVGVAHAWEGVRAVSLEGTACPQLPRSTGTPPPLINSSN